MESIEEIVGILEKYNRAYRDGKPLVSDDEYDALVESLRAVAPEHAFLNRVEPEVFDSKKEVRHPTPMLSIDKAYKTEDLERFVARVTKAAEEIGITRIEFRVTAKLDGLAGRDDGVVFASRGNGYVGYEISSAFQKGVVPVGGRGLGLGEIVMSRSYFETSLADEFEHPRNMVVGIVSSDSLNDHARKALEDGAVRFVPYATLDTWQGNGEELVANIETIKKELLEGFDYPVDGLVAQVTDDSVKEYMGATAHHYRWQVAIKTKGDTANTIVENIIWQVGRTGNVTPVMEVSPVKLSGATIRRVTAHNAGNVIDQNVGIGSEIEIIRSGEVIPKLERVVTASGNVVIPEECPVCGNELDWKDTDSKGDKKFLVCSNPECDAKREQRIVHWFRILGNADWFGIKTVKKLVKNGYTSLEAVYAMTEADFLELGFGPVQSKNLVEALTISKTKQVEDWRFLAAFGISDLGLGDSRKLLSHITIDNLTSVSDGEILAIHGFGEKTSRSIANGIADMADTITHMLRMNFNLDKTVLLSERNEADSILSGKGIVFTGKMIHGSRDEMQTLARKLGANVQTSVSGKTDYLVCGENVGAKKIEKAEGLGTIILTETSFFEIVEGRKLSD